MSRASLNPFVSVCKLKAAVRSLNMYSKSKHAKVEKLFLSAAERGDKKAIQFALENGRGFDVNCKNVEGFTALVLAIRNGHIDIIRLLVDYGVELEDSLLYAVDSQFTAGVQLLCDHIRKYNLTEHLYCRSLNGDLHPDITPVILAAHHNNYDIIKILLDQGVTIEDPDYYCFHTEDFTLQKSIGMINVYRALASQAFISLTSEDPINTAFELSFRLQQLSKSDYEFRYTYEELANQCEQFAADLLGHIRDSMEQEVVLNHDPEEWAMLGDKYVGQPSKVKKAINCKQEKFVAHPHCQQHLIERWYQGLPGWRKESSWKRSILTIVMGICFPLLNFFYIVSPHSRISKLLTIPYVKFVCYTASNLAFLVFLVLQAMEFGRADDHNEVMADSTKSCRSGDPNSILNVSFSEWFVVIWIFGITVSECQDIWHKGMKTVSENWSIKLFDFITMALYWIWILLRFTVCLEHQNGHFHLASENSTENVDLTGEMDIMNLNATLTLQQMVEDGFDSLGYKLENLTDHILEMSTEQKYLPQLIEDRMHSLLKLCERTDQSNVATESGHSIVKRAARAGARRRVSGGSTDGESDSFTSARADWDTFDPGLVAESLFAVAKVLSFMRLIRITVVNVQVGPMQISLGRMAYDIIRFLCIFCLVWFAFSVGLNQLYWFYANEKSEECKRRNVENDSRNDCDQAFGSVPDAMLTLFWALFGITDMAKLRIQGANHWFTESIGKILFAAYHVIGIVVLLNILIAMMSNTFTRIEEDADMQWKFSRSRLWLNFFDEHCTQTPPFNIFPTSDLWLKFCKRSRKIKRQSVRTREKNYQVVVQHLVRRYIFDLRRGGDDDDGQDPMRMFRQELSSFKYEMFDALSDVEVKIKQLKHRLDHAEQNPPPKMNTQPKYDEPGSEMFHALKTTLSPPQADAERTPPSPTDSSVFENEELVVDDSTPKRRAKQQKVSFEDELEPSSSYLSLGDMNLSDIETPLFTTSGSESILDDLFEPVPRDYAEVFNHNLPQSLRVPLGRYSTKRGKGIPGKRRRRRPHSGERLPFNRSNESLDDLLSSGPTIDPVILGISPQPKRKALTAMVSNIAGIALMPLSERWGPMKYMDDAGNRVDKRNYQETGNPSNELEECGTMV
ncbi:short transient receptor potential channel 4-like [Ptychodera flava]|uniref:short transient receptor potential channel 4-like n=1 Tax=Ptychodera flava TaxID=63121 RepID=UPI00396A4474